MGTLDSEYYFVLKPRQDDSVRDLIPSLSPDEDTAKLPFRYQRIPFGSKPLVFENGAKELFQKRGYTTVKNLPDVLFDGSNPVVRSALREKLLALEIPTLELQPAIYIDDWGKWHEDFWYLTFTSRLDCWDRKTSDYERGMPPVQLGGGTLHQVYQFSLNDQMLGEMPIHERRLFQMGGSLDAFVVAHRSVVGILRGGGDSGAQVLGLADYPDAY
jgi:hypothetical protein